MMLGNFAVALVVMAIVNEVEPHGTGTVAVKAPAGTLVLPLGPL